MLPELIRLPNGFPVRSFGVLLMIAVLVAVWLAGRRAARFGLTKEQVWDSVVWLVIPGVLGARVFYIAQHWGEFAGRPDQIFTLRMEGLTSFGGIVFGFLGFLLWSRSAKVDRWAFLDTVAVPVLVAQAIGRIGCLLNGCCYGRPTDAWYGVHVQGDHGTHVPAQVLDTALLLLGSLVLTLWERRTPGFTGRSFGWMIVVYGLSRFIYEFLRAGTPEEFRSGVASSAYLAGLPVTSAQVFALGMVAVGALVLAWLGRRRGGEPAGASA
jgi:phosphatidylglycerol---prolipoprotein diacylglyceryl transferase